MIIAFDGNVYTGKTTLINMFSTKYCKIREYCDYINMVDEEKKFENEYMNTQFRYLKIDALRAKGIEPSKIALLDRSFVSLCAHVWVLYKLEKIDIRKEFLSLLKDYIKKNAIIIPDVFIHVKCDYVTAKKRFVQNETTEHAKGTDYLLMDQEYFFFINKFNEKLQIALGQNLIIDTNEEFKETLTKVKNWIKNYKKNDKNIIINAIERVYAE